MIDSDNGCSTSEPSPSTPATILKSRECDESSRQTIEGQEVHWSLCVPVRPRLQTVQKICAGENQKRIVSFPPTLNSLKASGLPLIHLALAMQISSRGLKALLITMCATQSALFWKQSPKLGTLCSHRRPTMMSASLSNLCTQHSTIRGVSARFWKRMDE